MSSASRLAPMPPPKPRTLVSNGRNQLYNGAFLTPQDSDTDSGISADCDQGSPRSAFNPNDRRNHDTFSNIRSQSASDYLTPNSARKIAALSTTPRRLPLQPQQNSLGKVKYRVRFADQVDSGASTSSGSSSTHVSPRNDSQEIPMNSDGAYSAHGYVDSTASKNDEISRSASRSGTLQRSSPRRPPTSATPQPQPTYCVDGVANDPPPYTVAMQRLRPYEQPAESFRDAYIRRNVADTIQRRFRQRSSSLPRGNKTYYDGIDAAFDYPQQQPSYLAAQTNLMSSAINQLPGSLDNLHISMASNKRRKLPTAPLMGSTCQLRDEVDDVSTFRNLQYQMMSDGVPRTFERQSTLLRRTNMGKLNGAKNVNPTTTTTAPAHYESADYGPDGVRAQLIALDQRGFRRVLVEKMMPGPFGFYIATGMVAGQRGIFISRVSLPSLSPILTVGDEIIYVDDELVKGRSLEYVQSVIAGKTTVTITLLPAVGQPALC